VGKISAACLLVAVEKGVTAHAGVSSHKNFELN
jgi:hypothetical protein